MIDHLVLCKTKPETTQEQVKAMIDGLSSYASNSDGISAFEGGKSILNEVSETDYSGGYTVGYRMRFRGRAEIAEYYKDPDHVAIYRERMEPILDGLAAVDYEVSQ